MKNMAAHLKGINQCIIANRHAFDVVLRILSPPDRIVVDQVVALAVHGTLVAIMFTSYLSNLRAIPSNKRKGGGAEANTLLFIYLFLKTKTKIIKEIQKS